MRQVPRSPLSFKLQRVANVPAHPPPSTRLMSCAHIANRRLSRIIGARYFISVAVIILIPRNKLPPLQLTTSAIVAGHNESMSLRACVDSIEADQIVIVDDGSTDAMWEVAQSLLTEGLAHVA